MKSRAEEIKSFLADAGWSDAKLRPLAGDLSPRKYFRLIHPRLGSSILMDADPELITTTADFVDMTEWLSASGLSVPRIYSANVEHGLLLLEDFGDSKLTTLLAAKPERQIEFHRIIVDLLLVIRSQTAPDLKRPDAESLTHDTKLADKWYPGVDAEALSIFRKTLLAALQDVLNTAPTVSLRDFHTDNMIWLKDRTDTKQIGLLDYQDAFLTHPTYDLMSLVTDARTEVSKDVADQTIRMYCEKSGDSVDEVQAAVAILGAQRNLRILGIFSRAAKQDGNRQHLGAMPRVHRYLMRCCDHPALCDAKDALLKAVPAPAAKMFAGVET